MPNQYEPTREPFLKKWFFGISARAEHEEKVLRYIIHRLKEETSLHDIIREDYVRRNCSQGKLNEIVNDPEVVHACREHLWRTFRSGELDPGRGRSASQPPTNSSPADGEDVSGPASPDA